MHINSEEGNVSEADPSVRNNIHNNNGLVASGDGRSCKICYETEDDCGGTLTIDKNDGRWMHPCKCSGTMKWVHRMCMEKWLDHAPYQQKYQCTMCKYRYQTCWRIRPLSRWRFPDFNLSLWDGFEISLDFLCTYYTFYRVKSLVQGKAKSLLRSCLIIGVWKIFVASNRRLGFYRQLFEVAIRTFLESTVKNAI
uniref:RING-CH-type domain-containing protein n=1 Tax=Meloidogyne incognita TaxID=6306 RepID=A0A914L7U1_MELIC